MYFYSEAYGCLRILPCIRKSDASASDPAVVKSELEHADDETRPARESLWEWSNVFSPSLVGEHILTAFHQDGDLTLTRYFAIDVVVQYNQSCVTVRDVENYTDVPYRIDNDTSTHYLQIVQHLGGESKSNSGNQSHYMVAPLGSMIYAPQHPMEPPIVDILLLLPTIVGGAVQFTQVGCVTKDLRKLHTAKSALSDTVEQAAEISPEQVKSSLKHPNTLATGSVCVYKDARSKQGNWILILNLSSNRGKMCVVVQVFLDLVV